jgi:N6-L-threonylcarbamoyladenine synthase
MAIEANPVGSAAEGRWLADIVQQRTPSESRRRVRRQLFQQQQGVHPHIAFGVELSGLLDALHLGDLRQDLLQQPGRIEQLKSAASRTLDEHAREFVADPLPADLMNLTGKCADGRRSSLFNRESKARSEADASQHAQFVFFKTQARIADCPDDPSFEIGAAAYEIEHRAGNVAGLAQFQRIEQHSVNGEIAAFDVFFGALGKPHRFRMPAVGIWAIVSKCSDLSYKFATVRVVNHQHHAEMGPDGEGLGKHLEDGLRMGVGGHIEVLRLPAEQQIAHTSAGEVGYKSCAPQTLDDVFRCLSLDHHSSSMEYVSKQVEPTPGLSLAPGSGRGSGLILGVESSCDETAAAVVRRGRETLSNVVASQVATHAKFGGVVPELASREHLRNIVPAVRTALAEAGIAFRDLDAIAVTSGPGLAGALLVGITYAKFLAYALGKPLIAVNHLEGHIHAVLLEAAAKESPQLETPILALVVSGGHTHLYLADQIGADAINPGAPDTSARFTGLPASRGTWHYENVGRTVDDAAGEAFDKVAKLLGLPYPGGPWIDALAPHGNPKAVPFAFAQVKSKHKKKPAALETEETLPRTLFSFSGIKTAVLRYVESHDLRRSAETRQQALAALAAPKPTDALALCDWQTLDLIASFQHAVVGDLLSKTFRAAGSLDIRSLLVTGGVAANRELRARFTAEAAARNLPIAFPSLALSTDNAAMIAAAAWPKFIAQDFAEPSLNADPSLRLG